MADRESMDAEDIQRQKAQALMDRLTLGFNMTPFCQLMGLKISHISDTEVRARFEMKPDLVGNMMHQILHGGVIAAALDTVGGAIGMVAAYAKMHDHDKEERRLRLGKLGTIDMRVDYLQPGRGQWFEAIGKITRIGKKVVFARMELVNDQGDLIATGTATYMY